MNALYWIASVAAGVLVGAVQVLLLKKAAGLGDQKTVALSLVAKICLWGAVIALSLLIDVRALIGVFIGAAPVYSAAVIYFWRHRGD